MSENNGNGNGEDSVFELPMGARDAKAAAESVGLPYLNGVIMKRLDRLGIEAQQNGLLNVATGGLILTMEGLAEIQQMVLTVAREGAARGKAQVVLDAGMTYAILAKAQQGCAQAVNADGLAAKQKIEKKIKRTFTIATPTPMPKAV